MRVSDIAKITVQICILGMLWATLVHAKDMTQDTKIKWVGKFELVEKKELRDFIRQGKKYFVLWTKRTRIKVI